MDDSSLFDEDGFWICEKHPFQRRRGVCPGCLRDRLLLLCPDCAHLRPCGCLPSTSSASSSFSSGASFDPPRYSVGAEIGAVGRVASLIDGEPAFRRTRSAAFQFLRLRSDGAGDGDQAGVRRWAWLWPIRKFGARKDIEPVKPVKLSRSRSVSATRLSESAGGNSGDGRGTGWHWHFPSPIKAFRRRKSTKVVQQ
ncbi:hypothetical protein AXF42_Ash019026 [Apostasia shenzhenica]|uniref:Uncharacterized protein n=1 Tax=Apostasia shenzhenica TaxID=1088818 RepID=A0A2I0AC39_9ASPA|nr:hypothetical protein AXF42_Ash019026 [Apostasia shenzhenica]